MSPQERKQKQPASRTRACSTRSFIVSAGHLNKLGPLAARAFQVSDGRPRDPGPHTALDDHGVRVLKPIEFLGRLFVRA